MSNWDEVHDRPVLRYLNTPGQPHACVIVVLRPEVWESAKRELRAAWIGGESYLFGEFVEAVEKGIALDSKPHLRLRL